VRKSSFCFCPKSLQFKAEVPQLDTKEECPYDPDEQRYTPLVSVATSVKVTPGGLQMLVLLLEKDRF